MAWNQPLLGLKGCCASLETKAVPAEGRAALQHHGTHGRRFASVRIMNCYGITPNTKGYHKVHLAGQALNYYGQKLFWGWRMFPRGKRLCLRLFRSGWNLEMLQRKQPRQLFDLNKVFVIKSSLRMIMIYYFKITKHQHVTWWITRVNYFKTIIPKGFASLSFCVISGWKGW